ncbi:hypothetical protein L596_013163 [Steinernema carpocapsae]|uniref:BTB domain-containing protein n=1 Tax=Steinernema carpocapsae TaxID=34508 RepID=A0A4U5NZC0_STECR|nr:hypothetical protein L596_013163 [Steinernema carpocapsae]
MDAQRFSSLHPDHPLEIGEFKWSISDSSTITCKPKNKSRTLLWNCQAKGFYGVKSFLPQWNTSFGNNCTEYTHHFEATKVNLMTTSKDLHVEVVRAFYIDLADPKNRLIQNAQDSAKLKLDGEEIWISKKMLSFYSPYFTILFKRN